MTTAVILLAFYSWMRGHGRHAHVWLLLASPTVEQITSFQHKQTTYVFRKDHKHDMAALLGQVAHVCPPFSPFSASLCLRLPQTQADSELPALHYRPSTSTNRFKHLMHVLAKTAKEVKKEEEQKLVQLVEHPCESLVPVDLILRDERWQ